MKHRGANLPWTSLLFSMIALGLVALAVFVPMAARQSFGEPSPALNAWQRFVYSFELVWNAGDLTQPRDLAGMEQLFTINTGESVTSISTRLEHAGLIRNAQTFRTYLIWTGTDTSIQTGSYRLSPVKTGRDIALMLKSSTFTDVTFIVLPGWRMEEIAAALPTSGLFIPPDTFLAAASTPSSIPDFLPIGASSEGLLAPGQYSLPRTTTAEQLVSTLLQRFLSELTLEMRDGFANQGLTVYQAVILASIIQREAMVEDEMPTIASVFYNRLRIGMRLQSDPTVQYALGYNTVQATWWTNPLSLDDLHFDSLFNTYIYPNLPPGPISNPSTSALEAVANPAQTVYYYFQAKCDGSGLHNFAVTFQEHQQNYCP
jgi:UPF0755 protein